MSQKTRLPLDQAKGLAVEVCQLFAPYVERQQIAGSIRRGSVMVGDIEVCCIARQDSENLFGDPDPDAPHGLLRFINEGIRDGTFETRPDINGRVSVGSKMAWLKYRGFALDVFCFAPEQWGVGLLIRTGSAAFSEAFVTQHQLGGNFLRAGQSVKGWRIWNTGIALDTPEEINCFEVCGRAFIAPEDRT